MMWAGRGRKEDGRVQSAIGARFPWRAALVTVLGIFGSSDSKNSHPHTGGVRRGGPVSLYVSTNGPALPLRDLLLTRAIPFLNDVPHETARQFSKPAESVLHSSPMQMPRCFLK